jgi:hypothetical protein
MPLVLKTVESTRGPRWIGDAFRLYLRKPLAFTSLFVLFLFASMLVAWLPLVGPLLQFMSLPLLGLGFMVAGQSALFEGPVHPRQFIEPLRGDANKRRSLLILCLIYGVSAVLVLLLADAVSDHAWGRLQKLVAKPNVPQADIVALLSEPGVSLGLLVGTLGGTLMSVPFWHAPALVHWGGQGVSQSLFSSAVAVWRSKGAFFSYTLAWLGLVFIFGLGVALVFGLLGLQQWISLAGVPAGLMFSTVFYLSVLFTFNDSFAGAAPAETRPIKPTKPINKA